jgi:RNAse (barnase) inhibitor barstar
MSQQALKTHLAQAEQAGIYRFSAPEREALEKASKTLGFAAFNVSLEGCADLDAILSSLGKALNFPDWYGANLDALNDCLTDLSWHEAKGYLLLLSDADALHAATTSFTALNEVLTAVIEEWQAQGIPFWVFYEFHRAEALNGLPNLPTWP